MSIEKRISQLEKQGAKLGDCQSIQITDDMSLEELTRAYDEKRKSLEKMPISRLAACQLTDDMDVEELSRIYEERRGKSLGELEKLYPKTFGSHKKNEY